MEVNDLMKKDWNELEFTNIADFKRMAPAIIQLEISRISKITDSLEAPEQVHNSLVKARYKLLNFKETFNNIKFEKINQDSMKELFSALYIISSAADFSNGELKSKIIYIIDRLNDFINKCHMLY